jgi:hypothetical protein
MVYDSDEEHTKRKRQRLSNPRRNASAAVSSYRLHVQQYVQEEANPAAVYVDEEDMTDFDQVAAGV